MRQRDADRYLLEPRPVLLDAAVCERAFYARVGWLPGASTVRSSLELAPIGMRVGSVGGCHFSFTQGSGPPRVGAAFGRVLASGGGGRRDMICFDDLAVTGWALGFGWCQSAANSSQEIS